MVTCLDMKISPSFNFVSVMGMKWMMMMKEVVGRWVDLE